MHIKPAELVIKAFGGVRPTARIVGRTPPSVSKWTKAKDLKGLGGEIPRDVMKTILLKADELGLGITAQDLIFGRDIEDQGAA